MVGSRAAGWISGATVSIQVPEEMRREDGTSLRRAAANSKLEKHQQFRALLSVTVQVTRRHCPRTVCERHLAFHLLWYRLTSARPHLPGCTRLGNVAVERTLEGEVSQPQRTSVPEMLRPHMSRLSSIQKCSLEVIYGRMGSP